jgi:polyphenol oxidase
MTTANIVRVPSWSTIPGLVHGFLGRDAGLGAGAFRAADLQGALRAAGAEPRIVLAARQVHGADVVAPEAFAGMAWRERELPAALPAADALVGASADTILTVRTADCAPVLLVAPRARAVAAVHAGWRGLAAGVIEAAIASLRSRYAALPGEILAAVGPTIGACCYEFGAEHLERFGEFAGIGATPGAAPGKVMLDLRTLARAILMRAGVAAEAITLVGGCTVDDPALHSYRRDGAHAGRQLSYIGWRA